MVNTYKVLTITFALLLIGIMSVSAFSSFYGLVDDETLESSIGTIPADSTVYSKTSGCKIGQTVRVIRNNGDGTKTCIGYKKCQAGNMQPGTWDTFSCAGGCTKTAKGNDICA